MSAHPPRSHSDPTTTDPPAIFPPSAHDAAAQGGEPAAAAAGAAELAHLKVKLRAGLRQFPDFPAPGVLFEDIMPLFASPTLHADLARALELHVASSFASSSASSSYSSSTAAAAVDRLPSSPPPVDAIVGLESRGFLFGPSLALRLGAAFVPVRKPGKLPGPVATESFEKEYGADEFQMQHDALRPGMRVVVVDDIIATGGSAAAAGRLVRRLGADLCGYLFIMELDFLKGREKLDAPVHTLLRGQEKGL